VTVLQSVESLLHVLDYMQYNWYIAITIEYKDDGVRIIKTCNRDSTDCKTVTYDPRWDSKKEPHTTLAGENKWLSLTSILFNIHMRWKYDKKTMCK